jgi:hypothetical protein
VAVAMNCHPAGGSRLTESCNGCKHLDERFSSPLSMDEDDQNSSLFYLRYERGV